MRVYSRITNAKRQTAKCMRARVRLMKNVEFMSQSFGAELAARRRCSSATGRTPSHSCHATTPVSRTDHPQQTQHQQLGGSQRLCEWNRCVVDGCERTSQLSICAAGKDFSHPAGRSVRTSLK